MLEDVRTELLEMMRLDQVLRTRFLENMQDQDLRRELLETDARHTARLEAILDAHGWPANSSVGEDGATAAWMLAQHADQRPEFQRRCLELMRDAVSRGEASPKWLAYLHDRVCVYQTRAQRYGTQIRQTEAGLEPFELEEPETVDERRASVGLEPLADYLRSMQR
jgi:hypothetical protein